MICETCAHNDVCPGLRIATVVECENYQPRCRDCRFFTTFVPANEGLCQHMVNTVYQDDFCSMAEAKGENVHEEAEDD